MQSIKGLLCAGYPVAYWICHLRKTWLMTIITYIFSIATTTKPQKLRSLNWGARLRILRCSPKGSMKTQCRETDLGLEAKAASEKKTGQKLPEGFLLWGFLCSLLTSHATPPPHRPTLPTTHQEQTSYPGRLAVTVSCCYNHGLLGGLRGIFQLRAMLSGTWSNVT